MIKLVAKKEFYFDGKMLKPDDEFYSEEKFLNILLLSHSAQEASAKVSVKEAERPSIRSLEAMGADVDADSASEAPASGRRKYKRRDMAAQG